MEEGVFKTEWGRKRGLEEIACMGGAWGFRLVEVECAAAVATAAASAATALPVAAAAAATQRRSAAAAAAAAAAAQFAWSGCKTCHAPETVVCGGGRGA